MLAEQFVGQGDFYIPPVLFCEKNGSTVDIYCAAINI